MQQQAFFQALSEQDRKVLDSIFINYKIGGDVHLNFNPDIELEIKDIPEPITPEVKISIDLEKEAIKLTESGRLDEAISLFDEALQQANHRASIYNNKAQALRLKGNDEGALKDLSKAIYLSSNQFRIKCLALCQRGLLHRKIGNNDEAKHDFEEAAKLGSSFAKTQLVEMNPYSALCNQMLQSVFLKMQ